MKTESDAKPCDEWEIKVAKSFEEVEAIRDIWEQMQAAEPYPEINADIDRYLSVIKIRAEDVQPYIMLLKQNSVLVSMVIGLLQNTRMKCNLGRMTLLKPLFRELVVVYGGLLGNLTDEICSLLIRELMNVLRRGEVDVVFFNHLKTDSSIYHIARKVPSLFCRDHFPKAEQHWCMSIPDHIDRFWEACSHNRRKKLRKYTRRLEKRYPGQVKMVTFSRQEEVAEGLRIAANISANTYQRAFGGGLVDDGPTRAIFEVAAKKDWLRIYILFVADEPCAFLYILKYGRICFAEETGYSPKWKDWNVGSILHLEVVEQICGDPVVDTLDFGFGDVRHKHVGDSRQWTEAPVFIFAPRPFPVFVNLIRSSTLATSMLAQHTITGLGIRSLVQRYRRSRIVQKHARAECDSSLS